jgi:hypothetical protein
MASTYYWYESVRKSPFGGLNLPTSEYPADRAWIGDLLASHPNVAQNLLPRIRNPSTNPTQTKYHSGHDSVKKQAGKT